MTPISRVRLATNVDSTADNYFIGSISGTTMTITEVENGVIGLGAQIFGVNVLSNTYVTAFGTGTGGVGTYTVSQSQTFASGTLAAGTSNSLQSTQIKIQLDVHGPSSADNAQIISTLLWDQYAFSQMTSSGYDIAPLYCDDPKQIPFINAEQQYEDRWTIDAILQANPIVQVPQQFADVIGPVDIIDVNVTYPIN